MAGPSENCRSFTLDTDIRGVFQVTFTVTIPDGTTLTSSELKGEVFEKCIIQNNGYFPSFSLPRMDGTLTVIFDGSQFTTNASIFSIIKFIFSETTAASYTGLT